MGTPDAIIATPFVFRDLPRRERFAHGHRWGPWMLDARRLCLCRVKEGETEPYNNLYEIDLEQITGPFWLIDWQAQIATKVWGTPEVIGHLSMAFLDLFEPRGSMRPPVDHIDPVEVLRRRIEIGGEA